MKNNKTIFIAIILAYIIYLLLGLECPFKHFLAVPCPGCGMSRAYLAIIHLDIIKAFSYHPLFIMPIIWLVLLIMDYQGRNVSKAFIITIIIFIAVYFYRLLTHDLDSLGSCPLLLRAFWYSML